MKTLSTEHGYTRLRVAIVSNRKPDLHVYTDWLKSALQEMGFSPIYKYYSTVGEALNASSVGAATRPDTLLWDTHSAPLDAKALANRQESPEVPVVVISEPSTSDWSSTINLDVRASIPLEGSATAKQEGLERLRLLTIKYMRWRAATESNLIDGLVRKEDSPESLLSSQIEYLEELAANKVLCHYFPAVKQQWNDATVVGYEMDLFKMPSLRAYLLDQPDSSNCSDLARTILHKVLDIAFDHIYSIGQVRIEDKEFLYKACAKKLATRKDQSRELIALALKHKRLGNGQRLTDEQRTALLLYRDLLDGASMTYDGNSVRNPDKAIEQLINGHVFAELSPQRLTYVHGDLHFDNILVRIYPEPLKIMFVDPRGFKVDDLDIGIYDPAYDIGKLLHSAIGEYDFIVSGLRMLPIGQCRRLKNRVIFPSIETSAQVIKRSSTGASSAATSLHTLAIKEWLIHTYSAAAEYIRAYVRSRQDNFGDPRLLERSELYSAFHLLTTGPSHLSIDPIRALTLYVNGARLLDEFTDKWQSPQ